MPDISLPEVRLKDKLPEGLRDMTMDDIQNAMPEVRMPKFDLSGIELPKFDLGRETRRAARDVDKAARKAARDAGKSIEKSLPMRSGPNPVPIAILFMLGGLVVGWLLASSPTTASRINAWMDDLRSRFDGWRTGSDDVDDEWDTSDAQAYPESVRAPIAPDRFADNLTSDETGISVGPGELPEGMGTNDPQEVAARDR